jgi:Type II CAAX prenyl endopeptidase Rce1-like
VDSPILDGLIRIPEDNSYGVAIVAVFGIGGFSVASELVSRWRLAQRLGLWRIYSGILGITALWGIFVFGDQHLLATSVVQAVAAVYYGLAIGFLSVFCDRRIVRHFFRSASARGSAMHNATGLAANSFGDATSIRAYASGGPAMAGSPAANRHAARSVHALDAGSVASFTWIDAVLVAVSEELVYRWCLVRIAFLLPGPSLIWLCLAMITLLFALSHVWLGWEHAFAKLPLGIAMMAAVLIFGNILPAVFGHVFFNLRTQQDRMRYGR